MAEPKKPEKPKSKQDKEQYKTCPTCGNVTAPTMMEKFRNFITGGASGTMKKAAKGNMGE